VTGLPYEVQFGYCCNEKVAFASFDFALTFLRGYLSCLRTNGRADDSSDDGPRIVNVDNIDGADDAGEAARHGLTIAEWEALQDADAT
jgi:hypothetical protein